MTVVRLAAEERLLAAFARYDAAWLAAAAQDVSTARIELCRALLDLDEVLPVEVLAQLARDESAVARSLVASI